MITSFPRRIVDESESITSETGIVTETQLWETEFPPNTHANFVGITVTVRSEVTSSPTIIAETTVTANTWDELQ